MNRLAGIGALSALLSLTGPAAAQTPPAPPSSTNQDDSTRPAMTTVSGTTGLWYVPTSEVVAARKGSVSFYRTNTDDGQGFTDVSTFPVTFAAGLGNRAELFGNLVLNTRIDRDARPLFFSGSNPSGVGGGILVNYPLVRDQWIGNQLGDLSIGAKVNLLAGSTSPLGAAISGKVKLPVGNKDSGASSGKTDFEVGGILSAYSAVAELSGYAGFISRGNPDGYTLTNGIRWGVGAAFPQRYNLGLRLTTEIFGEKYLDDTITAPAGLTGTDGSPVPTSTSLRGPVTTLVGVTWQAPNGFFIGGAASWNVHMKGRDAVGYTSTPKDDKGLEIRIGFHPGAKNRSGGRRVSAPPAPGRPAGEPGAPYTGPGGGPAGAGGPSGGAAGAPGGPGAAAGPGGAAAAPGAGAGPAGAAAAGGNGVAGPAGAGPGGAGPAGAGAPGAAPGSGGQNRPPTVRASCSPCTVEIGRTSTVSADAQDPDGDPLTYRWTNAAGQLASPTSRQSSWTAPMQPGPVSFTVTVNDGRGGSASDPVTVQVVQPPARQFNFEDVHFEFDRYTLRPDALTVLDEAVTAMRANPTLRLQIEGHTCNIGTAEYNLALGERRAQAVREYLTSKGVNPERLSTVSYGEERPQYDNAREETRRLNRRAALVVRLQ